MSDESAIHLRLHERFQEVFGPPHHDLHESEQWSLIPSSGQGSVNVLLNGSPQGPLVWVFNSQDPQNAAKYFAVTHEREIDELIEQLKGSVKRTDDPRTEAAPARIHFLEDVLTTEQLASRPSRRPDYAAENEALIALAQGMALAPQSILKLTVDTAMRLCRGQSAGISILERQDEPGSESEVFRWRATTGAFSPLVGNVMPRNSPCGAVVDRNALLMFDRPEVLYDYPGTAGQSIEEIIMAPFHADGKPVGTVWVMAHDKDRKFDREDARLLASVSHFAAAAYQVTSALNSVQANRTHLKAAHDVLAIHSHELESIVAQRTRELVQSHQQLRLAERMATMGSLSAGLGHDMGNMVMAMRQRLEMLGTLADSTKDCVQILGDGVTYLQQLAGGLRLLSLDSDDTRLGPERFSLATWCASAHRVFSCGVAMGIVVECNVPDDLPDVLINRAGLTQAVYNLIQNASDAMNGQRGRIMVTAALDESGSSVLLNVIDEGPGMTDEVRQHCLDPSFRVTNKSTISDTGIGLTLVRTVVKAAGGSIRIDSELGRGTTFILILPIAK